MDINDERMEIIDAPLPTQGDSAALTLVKPIVSAEEALAAWQQFQSLKNVILTPGDYQDVSGKSFVKRSGWRKLAAAFGISDYVVREERQDLEHGGFVWNVVARAIAPNGRFCEALGSCASTERKFSHLDHDCRATAHTRAKCRAVSDLVGGGELSAEEMGGFEAPGGGGRALGAGGGRPTKATGWTFFWETMKARGLSPEAVAVRLGMSPVDAAREAHLTPEQLVHHEELKS